MMMVGIGLGRGDLRWPFRGLGSGRWQMMLIGEEWVRDLLSREWRKLIVIVAIMLVESVGMSSSRHVVCSRLSTEGRSCLHDHEEWELDVV